MPNNITPSAKQKSMFFMHVAAFIIINAIIWYTWSIKPTPADGFKYPWAIWLTSAWFLSLIAHWAATFSATEDKGHQKYTYDSTH